MVGEATAEEHREIQQFGRGLVGREVAARLHDLPELHVQALDRVGRVEQPTHLRRVREDRRDVGPVPPPEGRDRRILRADRARSERLEGREPGRLGRRAIDRPDRPRPFVQTGYGFGFGCLFSGPAFVQITTTPHPEFRPAYSPGTSEAPVYTSSPSMSRMAT